MIRASFGRLAAAVLLIVAFGIPASRAEDRKPVASSEKSHSPEEVFRAMHGVFQAEKAKGVHIRYLFHLTAPQGGDWWIIVNDGKMTMGKGTIDEPDCTISCTGADWVPRNNDPRGGT